MLFLIAIYRKLRSKVYRGLVFWLVASRSACGLTKYQDVLVSQLLADIVVQRDTIQLLTGLFEHNVFRVSVGAWFSLFIFYLTIVLLFVCFVFS
jgi:hypothetical protein